MSSSKIHILFIINPISGGKRKTRIPDVIDAHLDSSKFIAHYQFTSYEGHASELAREALNNQIEMIVAVGGDGTVNEIAAEVMAYDKVMGIIPFGSGNGLARTLKIPLQVKKAIEVINRFQPVRMDGAKFNERYFFNMAGMGFDADVSAAFAGNKKRGLKTYIEVFLQEMRGYRPQQFELEIDGNRYQRKAFMVSVANSSQYGNNVHISPLSLVTDGQLEVCVLKPFALYKLPLLIYQMVRAKTHLSSFVEIFSGKDIYIKREKEGAVHLDGEPRQAGKVIHVNVYPAALKVLSNL